MMKMDFYKHCLIVLLLTLLSRFSYAGTSAVPILVDFIQNEIIQTSLGTISVEGQSETGQYQVSWQLTDGNLIVELEEYQQDGTIVDGWQSIYNGSNNLFNITKTADGKFKYRIKNCASGLCTTLATSEYFAVDLPIDTPQNFHAIEDNNLHKVSWNTIENANIYHVEIAINNGAWQTFSSVTETSISHEPYFSSATKYRIKACDTSKDKCSPWSASSEQVQSDIVLESVAAVGATKSGDNHTASWLAVEHASSYRIELSFNYGDWFYVTETPSTSFTHSPQIPGVYQYRIIGCYLQFDVKECASVSPSSNVIVSTTDKSTPQNVTASKNNNQHVASWQTVSSATSYKIELAVDDSEWFYVTETTNTSFTHEPATSGDFIYRVQACFIIDGNNVCGNWSAPSNIIISTSDKAIPKSVTVVRVGDINDISWQAVENAKDYQLALSVNNGEWVYMNRTNLLSFNTNPKISGDFNYRVQACFDVNGSDLCTGWSIPSNTVEVMLPLSISGQPDTSIVFENDYYFKPIVTTLDQGELTFSIQNKPEWAIFNSETGELLGTPVKKNLGTFADIIISVSHSKTTDTLPAFAITVISENDAPVISGTPTTSVTVDGSYSFTPTATDADDDALTFSITGQPSWASFEPTTGALTGTPQASDIGVDTGIVISVSDGTDSVALPPFDIEVLANESDLTVSFVSPLTGSQLAVGEVLITVSSSDNSQTQDVLFSSDGSTWFSDVDGISPWTYDFSALPSGNYTIYAKAVDLSNLETPINTISIELVLAVPEITIDYTAATASYVVSWGAIAGATTYELEESIEQSEWQSLGSLTATNKTFTEQPYGDYNYRVKACDTLGSCSLFSVEKNVNVAIVTGQCPVQ